MASDTRKVPLCLVSISGGPPRVQALSCLHNRLTGMRGDPLSESGATRQDVRLCEHPQLGDAEPGCKPVSSESKSVSLPDAWGRCVWAPLSSSRDRNPRAWEYEHHISPNMSWELSFPESRGPTATPLWLHGGRVGACLSDCPSAHCPELMVLHKLLCSPAPQSPGCLQACRAPHLLCLHRCLLQELPVRAVPTRHTAPHHAAVGRQAL